MWLACLLKEWGQQYTDDTANRNYDIDNEQFKRDCGICRKLA